MGFAQEARSVIYVFRGMGFSLQYYLEMVYELDTARWALAHRGTTDYGANGFPLGGARLVLSSE